MPYIDFDKFHPITLSSELPEFAVNILRDRLVDSDVNDFFKKLQNIESNRELLIKKDELFDKCDEIIGRNIFLSGALPKFVIASMFAVKMAICDKLILDDKGGGEEVFEIDGQQDEKKTVNDCRDFVKKNYSNFLRATDEADFVRRKFNSQIQSLIGNTFFLNCANLADDVMLHLDKAVIIKDGTKLSEVSVPDILASASYVEDSKSSKINIREIFQELWEIKSLRPLLTVVAYSTQKSESPLRMVFANGLFNGNSSDYAERNGICRREGGIIATSYSKKSLHGENIPKSKAEIKGIIAHELHHFWEGLNYDNSNSPHKRSVLGHDVEMLPWPLEIAVERLSESFLPHPDVQGSNSQIKTQLNIMMSEIKKINKDQSVFVESNVFRDGSVDEVYQPFQIFDFLRSYPEDRVIQRRENVVRVSHVLGYCVGEGYTEDEVMKLISNSGLEECLKFFNQEKEQMITRVEKFAKETGVSFSQVFSEDPGYLDLKLTQPHELDLAIKNNDILRVINLCDSEDTMQGFKKDPRLLRKSVSYLVNLATDEGSSNSGVALSLFKKIKSQFDENQSPAISVIFGTVRRLTMDQDKVSSLTREEICEKASRSESFEEDRFGNSFIDYAVDAYQNAELKNAKLKQNKFYTKINSCLGLDDEWDSSMRLLIQRVGVDSKKLYGKNSKMLSDILPSGISKDSQYSKLSTRDIDNNI